MHRLGCTILILILALPAGATAGTDANPLEDAARRYRIQVYESYRLDRPALDQRLQAAESLLDAWRDRGAPDDEIDHLIDWFRRAALSSSWTLAGGSPEYLAPAAVRASAQPAAGGDRSTNPTDSSAVPGATSPIPLRRSAAANDSQTESHSAQPDDLPPLSSPDLIPERPIVEVPPLADQLPSLRLRAAAPGKPPTETRAAPATSLESYVAPIRSSASTRQAEVDLEILTAKIRSINLSLTAVEAELAGDRESTVEQLEAVVQDLTRLLDAADLVRLYYLAIPAEQRDRIEPLIDLGSIQAILAQRVFETRIRLVDEARTAPPEGIDERLGRLEAISDVIHRWNRDRSDDD
jgi:hypothetical protein